MGNTYMKKWYISLSKAQKRWLFGTIIVMLAVVLVGVYLLPAANGVMSGDFSLDSSISEIAPQLGVTGKALAKELHLRAEVPKGKPLGELGVTDEDLRYAVEHLFSHEDATVKYYIFGALVFGALIFLVRLGRPDKSGIKERKGWYPRFPYLLMLFISVIVCGFLLGKSPNPMEGAVKVFKSMVGLYPDPFMKLLAFLFFVVLSIVGAKLICGWACPFGALQEIIYSFSVFKNIKKQKVPFWLTGSVRGIIFVVMLLVLFGLVGGRRGLVIYHYVNPFNLFGFDFDPISILVMVIGALIVSFIFYRPFCQLVCPFGLISWACERLSIFAVRIDHAACTKCGLCIKVCPLEAAKGKVYKGVLRADCFSCARCLNVCPADAISYTCSLVRLKKSSGNAGEQQ
jgi:ferredoxin